MALGDIYSAEFSIENPSGASSFKIHYRETVANSSTINDTFVLANAIIEGLSFDLRDLLSDDYWHPAVRVRKHFQQNLPMYEMCDPDPVGTRLGPGQPASVAINLGLQQVTFPIKSNGRIFIPGIPEADTEKGVITQAYADGPLELFANSILAGVSAQSDTGVWEAGVISAKVLNLVPGEKDWAGAFAPITSIIKNPVLAIQRRRTTRVFGGS